MAKNQGIKPDDVSEESNFLEDDDQAPQTEIISEEKDFKRYVQICLMTGEIPENYKETFSEADKEKFAEKYMSWKKDGMKSPVLPSSSKKHVEAIQKLYRARDRGGEYVYYVIKGNINPVGIKKTPIYAFDNDGNVDKSNQIGTEESYIIKYDKTEFEKLIKKAQRDTSRPGFHIVDGIGPTKIKIAVRNPANFTKPFDELLEMVQNHKAL